MTNYNPGDVVRANLTANGLIRGVLYGVKRVRVTETSYGPIAVVTLVPVLKGHEHEVRVTSATLDRLATVRA